MTETAAFNPLLIKKYNRPVPRYTSYPTVPFWKEEIDTQRESASEISGEMGSYLSTSKLTDAQKDKILTLSEKVQELIGKGLDATTSRRSYSLTTSGSVINAALSSDAIYLVLLINPNLKILEKKKR